MALLILAQARTTALCIARLMASSMLAISLTVGILSSAQASGEVYIYVNEDGSKLISSSSLSRPGYKLLKAYTPQSVAYRPSHPPRRLKPRLSDFDPLIKTIADKYFQDRALIKAIIQVESSFNARAVSPKGARGLMQLMPATQRRFEVADAFNAEQNISGGTHYFSMLMKRYDNDIRKALAAYNAGEAAVDRYNGIPPYSETQAYVRNVIRLHKRYQTNANSAIYG